VAAAADNVEGSLHLHYHKLQRCIVMTFLVRECYGSPKKHEFYRSTGEHSVNICVEECFDKVLHHVNLRISKCKMTNVITMQRCLWVPQFLICLVGKCWKRSVWGISLLNHHFRAPCPLQLKWLNWKGVYIFSPAEPVSHLSFNLILLSAESPPQCQQVSCPLGCLG
jgi:hypothetical protein